MADTILSGGCLCGAVRFAARGPAEKPHTCSCRFCQRHTGAPTAAWVEFPAGSITWTGPGGAPSTWRSSDYSSRAFCPACGSSIGAIDDEPVIALLVGGFDDPADPALAPQYHSFEDCRPRWLCVETASGEE
ncbi:GFA family protein [Shinella sp. PSBB067]|uniref:GFA family protein n=1 Tax=Shinella sp. PSBB067 TaxID=2715959 RepID=UPI00193B1BB2|nr:GFA family protein [Shinella sp. PSBB067]QRI64173.1 GFA family protein [Shinella sp. PSBB067]